MERGGGLLINCYLPTPVLSTISSFRVLVCRVPKIWLLMPLVDYKPKHSEGFGF